MALKGLELPREVEDCLDNCFEAAQAAEACVTECITMDEDGRERCIQLCRDVADLTTQHARMMARESTYDDRLAAVCADLLEECAKECDSFDGATIETCADACRQAAKTCRNMAA